MTQKLTQPHVVPDIIFAELFWIMSSKLFSIQWKWIVTGCQASKTMIKRHMRIWRIKVHCVRFGIKCHWFWFIGWGRFSTINAKSYGLISFLFLLYGKEWLGHSAKFFVLGVKKKKKSFKVILYFIEESQMGLEQMNK